MGTIKQQRTAQQLRMLLSEIFLFELRDPRLSSVTITQVKIDRELRYAHVYLAALGDEREKEVMFALEGAQGFLRRELAHRLHLRITPMLYYHWDPTLASAERVNVLLDTLDIPPAPVEEEIVLPPKKLLEDDEENDFDEDEEFDEVVDEDEDEEA